MMTQKSINNETRRKLSKSPRKIAIIVSGVVLTVILAAMVIGIISGPQIGGVYSKVTTGLGSENRDATASYAVAPAATAAPAAAPARGATGSSSAGSSAQNQGNTNYNIGNAQTSPDRLVIRNATVSLISEDVEKTLADVRTLVGEQQGLVSSSNTNLRNDKVYANIVIQVPSPAYDATMARLRKVAYKVESENSTSQDVTEEFVDTEAQVRNLKASEAQLLELLKKATNIADTLQVQNQLTYIRGEIERRQGRVEYLKRKTDFSTINITVTPRLAVTEAPKSEWDFGKVFEQAWEGSVRGLQKLATVGITLGVYLIWVGPLALIALLVIVVGWRKVFPRKPVASANPESQAF